MSKFFKISVAVMALVPCFVVAIAGEQVEQATGCELPGVMAANDLIHWILN